MVNRGLMLTPTSNDFMLERVETLVGLQMRLDALKAVYRHLQANLPENENKSAWLQAVNRAGQRAAGDLRCALNRLYLNC